MPEPIIYPKTQRCNYREENDQKDASHFTPHSPFCNAIHYLIKIQHTTHQDAVVAHKFHHSPFGKSKKCRETGNVSMTVVTVKSFE